MEMRKVLMAVDHEREFLDTKSMEDGGAIKKFCNREGSGLKVVA